MKQRQSVSFILRYLAVCAIASSLFLVSSPVAQAATYGSGTYGGGNYNAGIIAIITNTVSSAISSVASSVSSAIANWTCSDQAPTSAPNLYEIDTKGSQATLYFAPAGHPYTNYYVSFGLGNQDEGNGGSFGLSQTTGALKYDVFYLKPYTTYTFKVRAGNGCKAGPWSADLTARSGALNSRIIAKYYPQRQASYTIAAANTRSGGMRGWITSKVSSFFPKTPITGQGAGKKSVQAAPQVQSQPQSAPVQQPAAPQPQKQPSVWTKIKTFFGI